MRLKGSVEEDLRAKVEQNSEGKEKKWICKKRSDSNTKVVAREGSVDNEGGRYSPCKHCGKQNHPQFRCWRRQNVRCRRCQKWDTLRNSTRRREINSKVKHML